MYRYEMKKSILLYTLQPYKDDDAENLAEWIGEKAVAGEEDEGGVGGGGGTTSEFDKFLAERAAANETARKSD